MVISSTVYAITKKDISIRAANLLKSEKVKLQGLYKLMVRSQTALQVNEWEFIIAEIQTFL